MVLSALASNMATPSARTMTRASAPDATFGAGTTSALSPDVARVATVAHRDETRG
jgi:hypothetical protein